MTTQSKYFFAPLLWVFGVVLLAAPFMAKVFGAPPTPLLAWPDPSVVHAVVAGVTLLVLATAITVWPTAKADANEPSKAKANEDSIVRHLGICDDGPLEILRVWFDAEPALGAMVRIPYTRNTSRVLMTRGTSGDYWVAQDAQMHMYKVTATRHDDLGTVATLQYKWSFNP